LRGVHDAELSSRRAKLGGRMLKPAMRRLRDDIDPERPGGAYLLGLRRLGVVAHGRFTRRGFQRAIEVAAHGIEEDVISAVRSALAAAGALRSPAVGGEEEDGAA
jgi:phosphate acyltransferase